MTPEGTPWEPITAERAGYDPQVIDQIIEFARDAGTAQLTVLVGKRCLIDESFSPEPVDVYAVQKGMLSLMLGIAVDKGMLALDDGINDHLQSGWTRLEPVDERRLTIRHLVIMTTGMDDSLAALGKIGETWRYNNVTYNYLKRILCEKTDRALNEITRSWLVTPLGMTDTEWVERAAVLPDGRTLSGLLATARDLAKLGRLVANRGAVGGERLVPPDYIDSLGQPGSKENPAWGLMWWNNNQHHYRNPMREEKVRDGNIIPAAPADLIAARGAQENHLGIIPSMDLVVARTTLPVPGGERATPFERRFYELLFSKSNKAKS